MLKVVIVIVSAVLLGCNASAQTEIELVQSRTVLLSLRPSKGPVGVSISILGSGFTGEFNIVHFGSGGANNVKSSNWGTEIVYTIPEAIGPCDLVPRCMIPSTRVIPGLYAVYVGNSIGRSESLLFEVVAGQAP
jgi:hypothetical protein